MEKSVLKKEEGEEIRNLVKPQEVIKKEIALAWDKKNIMVRLPKEIVNYFGITKENRFENNLLLSIKENPDGNVEKTFDIVKREKQRRKKNVKRVINKK